MASVSISQPRITFLVSGRPLAANLVSEVQSWRGIGSSSVAGLVMAWITKGPATERRAAESWMSTPTPIRSSM
jgi:hypothetical protein